MVIIGQMVTFRVLYLRKMPLSQRGTLFSTNMIIKKKECPFEKRVPFEAIEPQGHNFGTLFSLSVGCLETAQVGRIGRAMTPGDILDISQMRLMLESPLSSIYYSYR